MYLHCKSMEYALDHMVEENRSRSADKWVDSADTEGIEQCNDLLKEALGVVRTHYIKVLMTQIDGEG